MPGNATRENTAALSFAIEAARRKNRKAAREAGESIDGAALPAKDALVYLCQRDLATGDEIAAIAGEAQARAESDSSDSAGNTTGVETPEASRTAQRALEKIVEARGSEARPAGIVSAPPRQGCRRAKQVRPAGPLAGDRNSRRSRSFAA